ncbi:MAG: hypothetical protein V2J55_07290 [Candidatus Competibacteraceae bacterium]|nr:hypothetical protein [Candidatus Competibacteraceae bacterium]
MPTKPFSVDPVLTARLFEHRFLYCGATGLDALWWSLYRANSVVQLAERFVENIQDGVYLASHPDAIDTLQGALLSLRMEIKDSMALVEHGPWTEGREHAGSISDSQGSITEPQETNSEPENRP